MKSITEIISESSNMVSNINWIDWNETNQNEVFKEIIEEVTVNKKQRYKVNILVIAKEKKTKDEIDKFKGDYKIMPTEVEIYWNTNTNAGMPEPKVSLWSKNIANNTITKFAPMEMCLPKEFRKQ